MNARNQVHKEVARQTFAIIGKAAPTEEAHGIKGALRRAVQKSVPINGLFAGVRGDGIDPSAAGVVAVRIRFDHENAAELSRVENFFGFGIKDGTNALAANLQDAIPLLHRVHHGKAIFHGVGHRFFAVDVLAGSTGVHNHFAMLVVHGGDNDGVHIFTVQNASIVARGGNVLFDCFARGVVARIV